MNGCILFLSVYVVRNTCCVTLPRAAITPHKIFMCASCGPVQLVKFGMRPKRSLTKCRSVNRDEEHLRFKVYIESRQGGTCRYLEPTLYPFLISCLPNRVEAMPCARLKIALLQYTVTQFPPSQLHLSSVATHIHRRHQQIRLLICLHSSLPICFIFYCFQLYVFHSSSNLLFIVI